MTLNLHFILLILVSIFTNLDYAYVLPIPIDILFNFYLEYQNKKLYKLYKQEDIIEVSYKFINYNGYFYKFYYYLSCKLITMLIILIILYFNFNL